MRDPSRFEVSLGPRDVCVCVCVTAGVIPIDRDGTPLSTFLCVVASQRAFHFVCVCVCVCY